MKTVHKYFENILNGELILEQKFVDTNLILPVNYYNIDGKHIGIERLVSLIGFVEIDEEKFSIAQHKNV